MPPAFHPDFQSGDLELVSAGGKLRFRTHAATLARASGFFAAMFADAKADAANGEPAQITLDEDERTLEALLRIVHGVPFLSALDLEGDIDAVERLALAAEKYDVGAALEVVRLALHSPALRATEHALRRYALASRLGWTAIAQEAATASLDVVLDYRSPLPQMEMRDLERLLALRHSRIAAFTDALDAADGPFVSESSPTCRVGGIPHQLDPSAWTMLKQSMLLEMWQRPSGASVLADRGAIAVFRGMKCCMSAPRHNWERFLERLSTLIDGLPSELS